MANKGLVVAGSIVGVVALVSIITNPTLGDFRNQMESQHNVFVQATCKPVQTGSYLVFSRYEYRCLTSTDKYVGAFGNYYALDAQT